MHQTTNLKNIIKPFVNEYTLYCSTVCLCIIYMYLPYIMNNISIIMYSSDLRSSRIENEKCLKGIVLIYM